MANSISHRAFDRLVDRALASIPARFAPYLDNILVVVKARPSPQLRKELALGPEESLYGLYDGVPLPERGNGAPLFPDRIVIFREPLLEEFGDDAKELVAQIQLTVLHEIGHHFGLEDDAMAAYEHD